MSYTSPVAPGDEIARRFRLERPLGAGGMGAVWAATHLVTHKSVALKFLHKKHDDAEARRRVLREARASCAVDHPNVVAVHDVVEGDDGTPILVMDLLRGESLAQKLARERTLSPTDAIAMVSPLLSALVVAHAAGIVHRDLKPDNVFLVDGVVANVRILDFGVAKLLPGVDGAAKETNRLTETGAMIGTPHYMAPEQAFGESDVDARADLYATGAVLYECLAGVPPTDGSNLGQILKVLASGSIPPLATRAPSVPRGLAAIVDGLLKIERADRPASARVVLEQLERLERLERHEGHEGHERLNAVGGRAPRAGEDGRARRAGVDVRGGVSSAGAPARDGADDAIDDDVVAVDRAIALAKEVEARDVTAAPSRRGRVGGMLAVGAVLVVAIAVGVRWRTGSALADASAVAPSSAPVVLAAPAPGPSVSSLPSADPAVIPGLPPSASPTPAPTPRRAIVRPSASSSSSSKPASGTPLIAEPTF